MKKKMEILDEFPKHTLYSSDFDPENLYIQKFTPETKMKYCFPIMSNDTGKTRLLIIVCDFDREATLKVDEKCEQKILLQLDELSHKREAQILMRNCGDALFLRISEFSKMPNMFKQKAIRGKKEEREVLGKKEDLGTNHYVLRIFHLFEHLLEAIGITLSRNHDISKEELQEECYRMTGEQFQSKAEFVVAFNRFLELYKTLVS